MGKTGRRGLRAGGGKHTQVLQEFIEIEPLIIHKISQANSNFHVT